MAEPQEKLPMLDQLRKDAHPRSYRRTEALYPTWKEVELLLSRIDFLGELSQLRAGVISRNGAEISALHASATKLRQQVRTSAYKLHSADGGHAPNFIKFEDCKREDCIAARAVLAESEGK